jgi:hypothetical protein
MMYCLFASQSCCAEYRNKFKQVQGILDGGSSWIRGVGVAMGVFKFEGGGGRKTYRGGRKTYRGGRKTYRGGRKTYRGGRKTYRVA